jgi:hypothetical protein
VFLAPLFLKKRISGLYARIVRLIECIKNLVYNKMSDNEDFYEHVSTTTKILKNIDIKPTNDVDVMKSLLYKRLLYEKSKKMKYLKFSDLLFALTTQLTQTKKTIDLFSKMQNAQALQNLQKIYDEKSKILEDFKNDLNGHYITVFCGCLNETCIRLYWLNDTGILEYAIIALIEKKELSAKSEHDINIWTLIKKNNMIEKECKTYDELISYFEKTYKIHNVSAFKSQKKKKSLKKSKKVPKKAR